MHHRLRVSATKVKEILEHSLMLGYTMEAHLDQCKSCDDEHGICQEALRMWEEVQHVTRLLKILGINE